MCRNPGIQFRVCCYFSCFTQEWSRAETLNISNLRHVQTNLKSSRCTWGQPTWPILVHFWTNRDHWCHWLESAEHMDPLRHHRASSLLPSPHPGPSSLSWLQLWSICRAPRADGFSRPPWASQVWGNMVLREGGSKVETSLLLLSFPVGYHERSRGQTQKLNSYIVTVWAEIKWSLRKMPAPEIFRIQKSLWRKWNFGLIENYLTAGR